MYLIQELSKNLDAGSTSYYVYYHEGKLHAGVTWDYDWAFGQYIQNGDANKTVDMQTTGKFKTADGVKTLDQYDGWWTNSRRIYPSEGKLNLQAQLCQQDDFWDVVKAEWNENFYNIAKSYVTESAVSSSDLSSINTTISENISSRLSGKIKTFYDKIRMSTYMDEARWGFIAKDPIESWGSKDTGDTHNRAVISLNNFILNRLNWMNTGAATYHLSSTDYTIQPPIVTVDKNTCDFGETVTLTIEDKTDGDFIYTIYKDGEVFDTTEDKLYTLDIEDIGEFDFTVTATSKRENTNIVSKESEAVTVTVEGMAIIVDAPTSGFYNEPLDIYAEVKLPEGATVEYVLYDEYYGPDNENNRVFNKEYLPNEKKFETINFDYSFLEYDNYTFGIKATVTEVNGTVTTLWAAVPYDLKDYTLTSELTGAANVGAGADITLKANATIETDVEFTYEFYNADTNALIETNKTGVCTLPTDQSDSDQTYSYYVIVKCSVFDSKNGNEGKYIDYAKQSDVFKVTITGDSSEYTIKVLFKAPTTWAYKPNMTISVSAADGTAKDVEVTEADYAYISVADSSQYKNFYKWYSYDLTVLGNDYIDISVKAGRDYFYKGYYELCVGEEPNFELSAIIGDTTRYYFFALDNLNNETLTELTNVSNDTYKNITLSATNMIYDAGYITEEDELAVLASNYTLRYYGDANGDGKISVKDATFVQKSIANLIKVDEFSTVVSDINNDGKVTIKDATAIQKRIAGL